ncbi:MAG: N-methyl-L-tryptophan oxidase, partial [Planctomycetota bacterium]|nr:N-methyl-L-tryptophan oxidase [Planctomycetota bacterium]
MSNDVMPLAARPSTPVIPHYDAVVVGLGGVGSAALYHLARRGARVLGIDRYAPPHDRGSSHGHTRIIRQAYFEHPDYVPLTQTAYQLWHELEQLCDRQLYYQVGLLEVGPPEGIVVPGVLQSAARHGLAVQQLTAAEVAQQYPGFTVPPDAVAVYERDAGYLLVEDCIEAHLQQAAKLGARIHRDTVVRQWHADGPQISVQCSGETYTADRLVIAAGAWASELLADLGIRLRVLRKHLHWYACSDPRYHADRGCPLFFYETAAGYFYGFPQHDTRGVKVAEHSGGETVTDPVRVSRDVDAMDRRRVEEFLQAHLTGVSTQPTDHTVCLYTMSPDEHFIVDRHTRHAHVVFAAGLSGHGFKFTSVLGQALA